MTDASRSLLCAAGQFDSHGHGPASDSSAADSSASSAADSSASSAADSSASDSSNGRRLAGDNIRLGNRCHHYNEVEAMFNTPYEWKHCTNMVIGETYEIHWPHSAAGACGTQWQMQSPFVRRRRLEPRTLVFDHASLLPVRPSRTRARARVHRTCDRLLVLCPPPCCTVHPAAPGI